MAFKNTEEALRPGIEEALVQRKDSGLDGLVKGLQCVIINTETERFSPVVSGLLNATGYYLDMSFHDRIYNNCALKCQTAPDMLIRSRKTGRNPFQPYNEYPRSKHLPNTRLEVLVFEVDDLEWVYQIQKDRGVKFNMKEILYCENYSYIQTCPSEYTGTAFGYIKWIGDRRDYNTLGSEYLDVKIDVPEKEFRGRISSLDHAELRVSTRDRDRAIIECIKMTGLDFDFSMWALINSRSISFFSVESV